MKFARVATIQFARVGNPPAKSSVEYPGVAVEITCVPGQRPHEGTTMLQPALYYALAMSELNADALSRSATLSIDPVMRRRCETAIERVANAMAISNRCARVVQSCQPFFFLIPDTRGDAAALETLQYPVTMRRIPQVLSHTGINLADAPRLLGDRSEAAALLAEALADRKSVV